VSVRASRRAQAVGAVLVLASLGRSLLEADPRPLPCESPGEISAHREHTSAVACDGAAIAGPLRGPARLLFGFPLDLNREDARALEVLPGIGAVRAAAIVRERERRPFRDLRDLERVRGIGPATRRALEPFAVAAGPS
jgi:competence protein ComEA